MTRPTSFAATILSVEAERMEEARQAIADGWTPDDHPAECCPVETVATKPKRAPEERAQWARTRAVNAEARARQARANISRIEGLILSTSKDTAEQNIPITGRRAAGLERDIKHAGKLRYAIRDAEWHESRAEHWRNIEKEATQ